MSHGLLLFAHGARDPGWAAPFHEVLRRVRLAAPDVPVELAFLEFITPDIATAGARLAVQGCRTASVVPLFLGAGGHVRKDLPRLLDTLAAAHPQVQWRLEPAAGEWDAVIEALAQGALARARGG